MFATNHSHPVVKTLLILFDTHTQRPRHQVIPPTPSATLSLPPQISSSTVAT
jgi:hypothetical protein